MCEWIGTLRSWENITQALHAYSCLCLFLGSLHYIKGNVAEEFPNVASLGNDVENVMLTYY